MAIREQRWDERIPACVHCGTDRHPRSWRGFCVRCYPLVAKIEKIDRGLYRRRGRYAGRRADENDSIRKSAILELYDLKELEAPLKKQATGADVEGLLVTLGEVAGADPDSVDGAKYVFMGCVTPENMSRGEYRGHVSTFNIAFLLMANALVRPAVA